LPPSAWKGGQSTEDGGRAQVIRHDCHSTHLEAGHLIENGKRERRIEVRKDRGREGERRGTGRGRNGTEKEDGGIEGDVEQEMERRIE
jgi:hypothetical protein